MKIGKIGFGLVIFSIVALSLQNYQMIGVIKTQHDTVLDLDRRLTIANGKIEVMDAKPEGTYPCYDTIEQLYMCEHALFTCEDENQKLTNK